MARPNDAEASTNRLALILKANDEHVKSDDNNNIKPCGAAPLEATKSSGQSETAGNVAEQETYNSQWWQSSTAVAIDKKSAAKNAAKKNGLAQQFFTISLIEYICNMMNANDASSAKNHFQGKCIFSSRTKSQNKSRKQLQHNKVKETQMYTM